MEHVFYGKYSSAKKKRSRRKMLFYVCVIAFPVLQFLLFYVLVNLNSILLAFRTYDIMTGEYSFAGFNNFLTFFSEFGSTEYLRTSVINSLIVFFATVLVGTVFALAFSFYIYKKSIFFGFFKIMLFLPQIISSIALVIMFEYFSERAFSELLSQIFKREIIVPLSFSLVLFYTVWSGFGISVLLYSGAMTGISYSIVESAKLDGITPLKEFWHITLPLIYPTIVTFVVVGIAGIFVNQMNLFSFFGLDAEYGMYNFGYYIYRTMKHHNTTMADYPRLAAIGLVLTGVTLPVTLIVRRLMEKFGPSVER